MIKRASAEGKLMRRVLTRYLRGYESALFRYSKRLSRKNLYQWLRHEIGASGIAGVPRVVLVGAGGEIAKAVRDSGVDAIEIDIDPARGPDVVADVSDMTCFEDGTVDAIICMEVLEHVHDPRKATSEMFRVLRPGGVVVGSSPFLLGLHEEPHDYFRFTLHGIALLFRKFETMTIRPRNSYMSSLAALVARLFAAPDQKTRTAAAICSPLLFLIIVLIQLGDAILPSGLATTGYFYVFRRPRS